MNEKARELEILPELKHNSLPNVCKLADAGYIAIFHQDYGGVTVHSSEDIVIKLKNKQSYKGGKIKVVFGELPSKTK